MENFNEELFLNVIGFEGFYQASNFGRIRCLGHIRKSRNNSFAIVKERILKPELRKEYYSVTLSKNGIKYQKQVHRLVWEAFNGTIPEGMQVNHINEVKTDNRLSNLNLMTPKENINWGTGIERMSKTKTNGKLSKQVLQYDLNGNFIKEWPSVMEIYRKLHFHYSPVSRCCRGRNKTAYGYVWKYK